MRRRVLFHLGLMKTGTTTTPSTLRENAAVAGAPIARFGMDAEAAAGQHGLRLAGSEAAEIRTLHRSAALNAAFPVGAIAFMQVANASLLAFPVVLKVSGLVEAARDVFMDRGPSRDPCHSRGSRHG